MNKYPNKNNVIVMDNAKIFHNEKLTLLIEQKNITKKCYDINFFASLIKFNLHPIISIPNSFNKISGLISAICDTVISSSNFLQKFVYLLSLYCLSSSFKNSLINNSGN